MLRSIQGIAYNMKVQADRMNVIASNVANINTYAYKKEVINIKSFDDALLNAVEYNSGGNKNQIGSIVMGNSIDQKRIVFEQGFIEKTDFKTDMGISGDGFFVLDTPSGTQYARAGNFAFDKNGFLITQDGSYVMGEKGRIQVPNRKINVDSNGVITSPITSENIVTIDKFKIVEFQDIKQLNKSERGNFTNADPMNIKAQTSSEIQQGFLESSNVSIVEETRDMMEAKRNYESCQQIIKMIDDTSGKAASEIGRL